MEIATLATLRQRPPVNTGYFGYRPERLSFRQLIYRSSQHPSRLSNRIQTASWLNHLRNHLPFRTQSLLEPTLLRAQSKPYSTSGTLRLDQIELPTSKPRQ